MQHVDTEPERETLLRHARVLRRARRSLAGNAGGTQLLTAIEAAGACLAAEEGATLERGARLLAERLEVTGEEGREIAALAASVGAARADPTHRDLAGRVNTRCACRLAGEIERAFVALAARSSPVLAHELMVSDIPIATDRQTLREVRALLLETRYGALPWADRETSEWTWRWIDAQTLVRWTRAGSAQGETIREACARHGERPAEASLAWADTEVAEIGPEATLVLGGRGEAVGVITPDDLLVWQGLAAKGS